MGPPDPKETTVGSGDVLYAVVQFEGETWQAIDKVIVMFDSATAADVFALERGLADYAIAPLCVLGPPQAGATPGPP
jgi:hypothetical protein